MVSPGLQADSPEWQTHVSLTSSLLSSCLALCRCLVEKGDVAFVKDQTVMQNTEGTFTCSSVPTNWVCWAHLCSGCLCGCVMDSVRLQSSASQPVCSVKTEVFIGVSRIVRTMRFWWFWILFQEPSHRCRHCLSPKYLKSTFPKNEDILLLTYNVITKIRKFRQT